LDFRCHDLFDAVGVEHFNMRLRMNYPTPLELKTYGVLHTMMAGNLQTFSIDVADKRIIYDSIISQLSYAE
jgi:hypothetical protein